MQESFNRYRLNRLIITLTILGLLLAACSNSPEPFEPPDPESPSDDSQDANPSDDGTIITDDPNAPVSSDDPVQPTPEPTLIEGEMIAGLAVVEGFEVLILESFPVQIQIVARGGLPDGCTTIDEISTTRDGNTFKVTITTIRPADAICTESIVPFEESISLDVVGLLAGTYPVNVNNAGGSFTLQVDNIPPGEPIDTGTDSTNGPFSDLATINRFDVQVSGTPLTVEVTIGGTVSDGCVGYIGIIEEQNGNTITLSVGRNVPSDVICTQAITEFEQTYTLQSSLVPGTYTLIINSISGTFSIQ